MKYNHDLDLIHMDEITKQNNLSIAELNQSEQNNENQLKLDQLTWF